MRHATQLLRALFSVLVCAVLGLHAAPGYAYDYEVPVVPTATYLQTVNDPLATGPHFLRLQTIPGQIGLGYAPGDILRFQPFGLVKLCEFLPPPSELVPCDFVPGNLMGVFTSDANPPHPGNIVRAGPPINTMPAYFPEGIGTPTDLLGDFAIPWEGVTVVRIPPGAVGLWVQLHDSYYSDNVLPGENWLRYQITKGCPDGTLEASGNAPFVCLAAGLTQELYATAPGFFGGIAFAPDGDPVVNFCNSRFFPETPEKLRLRRFDAQTTELVHGNSLHPQVTGSPFPSMTGCGMANDLSGNLYSNTTNTLGGVVQLDPATGAVLAGPLGGIPGNGLGLARDPQTGNLVYVGYDSQILYVPPDGGEGAQLFSDETLDPSGKVVDGIFFDPTGNFLFLAQFPQALLVMNRNGEIVQSIHVPGQPDGVAFHAVDPKFVATINTDGTITRFDFPGGSTPDYTQPPTQTLIASGGFRGDISQVGPDTCLYVPQEGARYADGTISDPLNNEGQRDNSIVRICPGFAPPTGTTLTTVAGNGEQGFNGDTDPATGHPTALEAQLDFPIGVTFDAVGHVYFVDQHNHRVRRVDANTGFISTVAGTGVAGFNGDGIQATGAQLNVPNGLAVDSAGNLFIADLGNQRVRRVCLNAAGCGAIVGAPALAFGVITTVAGTGNYGPAVNGGLATAANLFNPTGVAIHAGNLYIADSLNQQVRRVTATGTIIAFAGTGFAGFNGDGLATAASLNSPLAVAVHASSGNVYIADEGNNRIRRVSAGMMTTVAGNGVAGFSGDCIAGGAVSAQLNAPSGVAVDASEIVYIGDLGNNRIRRLDGGTINSLAVGGELNSPYGVATNAGGDVLVADLLSQRVRRIGSPTGCFVEP